MRGHCASTPRQVRQGPDDCKKSSTTALQCRPTVATGAVLSCVTAFVPHTLMHARLTMWCIALPFSLVALPICCRECAPATALVILPVTLVSAAIRVVAAPSPTEVMHQAQARNSSLSVTQTLTVHHTTKSLLTRGVQTQDKAADCGQPSKAALARAGCFLQVLLDSLLT
jgi:hypothetical protein